MLEPPCGWRDEVAPATDARLRAVGTRAFDPKRQLGISSRRAFKTACRTVTLRPPYQGICHNQTTTAPQPAAAGSP
jgi:hypothetical protein